MDLKVQAGTVLVAEPFMTESPFRRSVVVVCEHRPDGSVGFVLNKKIGMTVNDLIGDFPEFESDVYYGGPVATDTIHYLHNVGELLDDSTEIARGVYWGGNYEKLKFLIRSELVLPKNIKFFVGYSGWSAGQLQSEIKEGTWILDQMYANYAFKKSKVDLWTEVLHNKGNNYTVIAQIPKFPSLN